MWTTQVENQIKEITNPDRLIRMKIDLERLIPQVNSARGGKERKRESIAELSRLHWKVKEQYTTVTGNYL